MSTYFRDQAQGAGAIAANARAPRAAPAPGFRRAVGYVSAGDDFAMLGPSGAPTTSAPRAPSRTGMPPRRTGSGVTPPPVMPPVRRPPPPTSVVHPLRTGMTPPAPAPTSSSGGRPRAGSIFGSGFASPATTRNPRSMTIVGTSAGGAAPSTITTIAPVTQPGTSTTVTTTTTGTTNPRSQTIVGGSGGGGMVGAPPKSGADTLGPIDPLPDDQVQQSADTAAMAPAGAKVWLVLGLGSVAAYAVYRLTKRRSS